MGTIESTTDTSTKPASLLEPDAPENDAESTVEAMPQAPPDRVWDRWMLAIVAIGAVLRMVGLTRQSMWYDELFTVFTSMQAPAEIIQTAAGDTSPPLFYFVEALVMQLLGKSEFAMRIVPALAGIATIWVIYLVGKRLFDAKTAFWAGTLFAVSLMPLRYAQEARAYSFLMLFAALGLLTLLRLAENPGWLNASLFGLVLVATVYNHPYGLFGDAALVLCMVAIPSLRRRTGWWGVGATGVAALLFVPWGLVTLNQIRTVGEYVEAGTWHLRPERNVLQTVWAIAESYTPWPYPKLLATAVFLLVMIAGLRTALHEPGAEKPVKPPKPEPKPKVNPAPPVRKDTTIVWNREDYTSSTTVVTAASIDAAPSPKQPEASTDAAFKLARRDAVILLGATMLLPIVAGIALSVWVLPIQELRAFLIGLPAAYLLVALGAVSLKRWVSYTLLGILIFGAVLGGPVFYSERSKGYYREAVRYLLENNAQSGKIVVSSNFLPLNMNIYSIIEGYETQFDLETVKWWYQGEQLDKELHEVLKNRESVYVVTAFVPFTEGDATAFDDSMSRAEGWKLAETRNFNNLPKVQKWVLGESSQDPSRTVVPSQTATGTGAEPATGTP